MRKAQAIFQKGQQRVDGQPSNLTLTVPLQIRCSEGRHEVTVTIIAWGMVEIFSPCQFLPETVRSLTGSDCLKRLPYLQAKLAQGFYDDQWELPKGNISFANPLGSRKVSWFLSYWRQNLPEAAEHCLRERFGFEGDREQGGSESVGRK